MSIALGSQNYFSSAYVLMKLSCSNFTKVFVTLDGTQEIKTILEKLIIFSDKLCVVCCGWDF